MCGPIGFRPNLPKGMTMPEGYTLEGESGEGDGKPLLTIYYWSQRLPGGDWRFGPNETDKRKAVRQAWRDQRSGGTDPSAIDPYCCA